MYLPSEQLPIHPYFETGAAFLTIIGGNRPILQCKDGAGEGQTDSDAISRSAPAPVKPFKQVRDVRRIKS